MWIILTCPLIGVCNPIRWDSNASRKQASKAMMKQAAEKVPHLHTYSLMTNVNTFYKMTWKRLKKGMKASTLFHNGSECLSPIWIIFLILFQYYVRQQISEAKCTCCNRRYADYNVKVSGSDHFSEKYCSECKENHRKSLKFPGKDLIYSRIQASHPRNLEPLQVIWDIMFCSSSWSIAEACEQ